MGYGWKMCQIDLPVRRAEVSLIADKVDEDGFRKIQLTTEHFEKRRFDITDDDILKLAKAAFPELAGFRSTERGEPTTIKVPDTRTRTPAIFETADCGCVLSKDGERIGIGFDFPDGREPVRLFVPIRDIEWMFRTTLAPKQMRCLECQVSMYLKDGPSSDAKPNPSHSWPRIRRLGRRLRSFPGIHRRRSDETGRLPTDQ